MARDGCLAEAVLAASLLLLQGGQKVYLEVRGNRLKIVDHLKRTLICKQRLTDIRVFAIGSNNERDFGYIAFDSDLRLHKCQVFRLHSPAQSFLGSLLNSVKSLSEDEQQEWDSTVKGERGVGAGWEE